ncbi:MAG: hypothetical protein AMJ78_09135 [Omnitrophica WOR_2 bacterium SM23_29]|nr:MAG: hypothetical protein AMJ78_09135 [Omnitrophica WOR_2 bacterium SM23_29]
MRNIPLKEIVTSESSYVDPNGFVFFYRGEVLRAISSPMEEFYRSLFKKGVIDKLIRNNGLIESEISDYAIPELGCKMVIRHRPIKYISYCVEWSPSMFKDAALTILDLNTALLEDDCMLQDAYPWNVLFDLSKPVFIDFASIVPADDILIWPAYQQFLNFFMFPLELMDMGKGKVARALLFDHINGVTQKDYIKNLSCSYWLRHPIRSGLTRILDILENRLSPSSIAKKKLRGYLENASLKISTPELRKKFTVSLKKKISKFNFHNLSSTWKDYYKNKADIVADIKESSCWSEKQKTVSKLLDRLNPPSFIDLGCNIGWYSILAAQKRIGEIISIDSDEVCIDMLYKECADNKLPILPLIINLLSPTPAYGFLSTQFNSAIERLRCDTVLALAVTHHLHITGRQSYDQIANLFRSLGRRAVVEYVDKEDEKVKLMEVGRKIDYNFESFCASFKKVFNSISVFPSDLPTRQILLCE